MRRRERNRQERERTVRRGDIVARILWQYTPLPISCSERISDFVPVPPVHVFVHGLDLPDLRRAFTWFTRASIVLAWLEHEDHLLFPITHYWLENMQGIPEDSRLREYVPGGHRLGPAATPNPDLPWALTFERKFRRSDRPLDLSIGLPPRMPPI